MVAGVIVGVSGTARRIFEVGGLGILMGDTWVEVGEL